MSRAPRRRRTPNPRDSSPTRTCIGCQRRASPAELTRIVRESEGSLQIGRSLDGRGAWLCTGSATCAMEASKRRAFARAFRAPVAEAAVKQLVMAFVPQGTMRETDRPVTTGSNDEGAG